MSAPREFSCGVDSTLMASFQFLFGRELLSLHYTAKE
jgi:hypothetical protein